MKEIYATLSQIGQYTNPFAIISGAVLYGITALILTIIVLIIFRKKIRVPRRHKALKVLAYSYFILLPLLSGFLWAKWGFFKSLRKDIKAHTEVYIKQIPPSFDTSISGAVHTYMQDNKATLSTMSTDQLIDVLADVIYTQYYSTLSSQETAKQVSNTFFSWVLKLTKGKGMAQLIKHNIHKILKEKLGLDEEVSKELMASRIEEVVRMGLFAKIALIQADHFLKGIQKGVLILFCILMAVPLAEVLIAHYLLKKKPPVPQAKPVMTQV
ncbi:hypothetical protein [Chitinophaga agri]|uniref:Uncharacterized protein n=1 Tax=Chitinophaga agri TaxID=2703787 RepID=A0A6B9ZFP4_9BACT|nr:hypothetical protein [Chitinophaga agri]QHS60886.1 hypothetical protein GWR21_15170 [Chitinophaga agri]